LRNHDIAMGDTVDVWAEKPLARKAAGMGIRTMLSGWGGDQFISHYGNDVYAERVLRGEPFASLWELLRASRATRNLIYSYPNYVYSCIVQPILRAYRPPFGSRYRGLSVNYLDYASPDLRMAAAQSEQTLVYKGLYLRDQQLCSFQRAHLGNRVSSWAVSGRALGLGYTYPLLDKRLVEMAVAVPIEVYRRNNVPRYLFRRAVRKLQPDGFWRRTQKYEPYRVERTLRISVDALRAWALERNSGKEYSQFIDTRRLISEIKELDFRKIAGNYEMACKIMAINRSILVLGLERYL
jgi:asparagine synthase (glutamine-hydrolysing)